MFVDFVEWNTISKSSQLIKHFLVTFDAQLLVTLLLYMQ